MDLKSIVQDIQKQRIKDSYAAIKSIAASEKYLQQSYEGRYLFELIQNVRDACKVNGTNGAVTIKIIDGTEITVSNTGAPFNERGINSITTIGDSPKDSHDFIGFKGIGFKSVNEVSDRPSIVTQWGTVVFDRKRSRALLEHTNLKDNEIPLFFIPHFDPQRLTEEELENGIVTKIVLPFKSNLSIPNLQKAFEEIGVHQLLLLGNLKIVELIDSGSTSKFTIVPESNGKVVVSKNSTKYSFKHFKPATKIKIPPNLIELLEDKEYEIFQKDPYLDISLLFDLDEHNRFSPFPDSKLYLFYPTDISSGFNFIIHSYFLVTPDRKNLRSSDINKFILEQVGRYIGTEWLSYAKRIHSSTFLDFLVFIRNKEAPILDHLYNSLIEVLKSQKFFYDGNTRKFYNLNEIIMADGFDKGLFPGHRLNNKQLIYIQQEKTRDWLLREFKIDYLNFETIANHIEAECLVQMNARNIPFFENLYRYLVLYDDLNLRGRKILLTNKLELLSSDDYVFYGFKEKIKFPASIDQKINFIHPSIIISDQRQGRGQTGFVEYNTELLVRRLITLYDDPSIPKIDILNSLLSLNISDRLSSEIRSKILFPTNGGWINHVKVPPVRHLKKAPFAASR